MQINRFMKAFKTTTIALLLTSSIHADCVSAGGTSKDPQKDLKPGPFAFAYTRDAGLQNPMDFHFYGDFIVMQAQEDGLDFAVLDADSPGSLPIHNGSVQGFSTGQQEWSWEVGFRLGVGGLLPHGDWALELNWLRFKLNQEVSQSVKAGAGYSPLWLITKAGVPDVTNAATSARWHFKINVVDGTLGKPYYVSRYFSLNPYWGLRAACINQAYTARYSGRFGTGEGNEPTGSEKTRATNDFWGAGPRVGMNAEWLLAASHLKFMNGLSFAALMGNFAMNQCAPGASNYTYNHNFNSIAVNMDLNLGFGWGIPFNEDRSFFSLTAMYEFQQWWDQNWMRITQGGLSTFLSDVVSRGDLRLNSFSLRFQFDF